MSGVQKKLTELVSDDEPTPYRSIVKDGYSTRDEGDAGDTRLEIAAWVVMEHDPEKEKIKDDDEGTLDYAKILDIALADAGAEEISRRTGLKSYADDRGGRAESTIRGYRQNAGRLKPKDAGGLPSGHPVKRVLRRYARSNDLGHFQDDKARDDVELVEDAAPIDMAKLTAAYRLARSIASQQGFVFAPQSGEPEAVEDNERIDRDEIRRHDRPLGETHAACLLEKPSGELYEYEIDLDNGELISGGAIPPGGF